MDEDEAAQASLEFSRTIREQYARSLTTVEANAEGGGPAGGTSAGEADFGSGVRRAVGTPTDMNTLIRAAALGVAYKGSP
jgi:hypothetical protein